MSSHDRRGRDRRRRRTVTGSIGAFFGLKMDTVRLSDAPENILRTIPLAQNWSTKDSSPQMTIGQQSGYVWISGDDPATTTAMSPGGPDPRTIPPGRRGNQTNRYIHGGGVCEFGSLIRDSHTRIGLRRFPNIVLYVNTPAEWYRFHQCVAI